MKVSIVLSLVVLYITCSQAQRNRCRNLQCNVNSGPVCANGRRFANDCILRRSFCNRRQQFQLERCPGQVPQAPRQPQRPRQQNQGWNQGFNQQWYPSSQGSWSSQVYDPEERQEAMENQWENQQEGLENQREALENQRENGGYNQGWNQGWSQYNQGYNPGYNPGNYRGNSRGYYQGYNRQGYPQRQATWGTQGYVDPEEQQEAMENRQEDQQEMYENQGEDGYGMFQPGYPYNQNQGQWRGQQQQPLWQPNQQRAPVGMQQWNSREFNSRETWNPMSPSRMIRDSDGAPQEQNAGSNTESREDSEEVEVSASASAGAGASQSFSSPSDSVLSSGPFGGSI